MVWYAEADAVAIARAYLFLGLDRFGLPTVGALVGSLAHAGLISLILLRHNVPAMQTYAC